MWSLPPIFDFFGFLAGDNLDEYTPCDIVLDVLKHTAKAAKQSSKKKDKKENNTGPLAGDLV